LSRTDFHLISRIPCISISISGGVFSITFETDESAGMIIDLDRTHTVSATRAGLVIQVICGPVDWSKGPVNRGLLKRSASCRGRTISLTIIFTMQRDQVISQYRPGPLFAIRDENGPDQSWRPPPRVCFHVRKTDNPKAPNLPRGAEQLDRLRREVDCYLARGVSCMSLASAGVFVKGLSGSHRRWHAF